MGPSALLRPFAIVVLLGVTELAPAIVRGATHQVTAQSSPYVFAPSQLTVTVGDTVTWTMAPGDPHTVTSGTYNASGVHPDGLFDSNTLVAGQTFSYTFTVAGEIPYVCEIHADSGMVGRVVVQAAATPQPTPAPTSPPTSTPTKPPTAPPTPVLTVTASPASNPTPAATESSGDPPSTSPTGVPSPTSAAVASSGSSPEGTHSPAGGEPGVSAGGGGLALAIAMLIAVALAVGVVVRMILAKRRRA